MARRRHARALSLAALLLLAARVRGGVPRRRRRARGARELRSRRRSLRPHVAGAHRAHLLRGPGGRASPSSRCWTRAARPCPACPRRRPCRRPARCEVTPSDPLVDGVYTVNWRVVSAVDGHVETGAFAFGVGETPAPGSAVVVELLHTSPLGQRLRCRSGRWLLYVGLILLVGAAIDEPASCTAAGCRSGGVVVLRDRRHRRRRRALPAWSGRRRCWSARPASCRSSSPAGPPAPARARRGTARLHRRRGGRRPLAGALEPLAARRRRQPSRDARPRARRPRRCRRRRCGSLNIAAQWVHITAIGVWVGGLFWLLLGLRGRDAGGARRRGRSLHEGRHGHPRGGAGDRAGAGALRGRLGRRPARHRATASRCWSRSASSPASWLWARSTTSSGCRRCAAATGSGPRRFALNSRGELAVALGVLAATAILTALPPGVTAAASGAASAPSGVTASGEDYATTVRVSLAVTPGRAGRNDYLARVEDYEGDAPAAGVTAVKLECSVPSDSGVNPVTVSLERAADGTLARQRAGVLHRRPVACERPGRDEVRRRDRGARPADPAAAAVASACAARGSPRGPRRFTARVRGHSRHDPSWGTGIVKEGS